MGNKISPSSVGEATEGQIRANSRVSDIVEASMQGIMGGGFPFHIRELIRKDNGEQQTVLLFNLEGATERTAILSPVAIILNEEDTQALYEAPEGGWEKEFPAPGDDDDTDDEGPATLDSEND